MSTKYAYKVLDRFDPVYYRQWASTVRDAFAERDWSDYLEPTDESKDPETSTTDVTESFRAKAFLSQSIPLEHKASIEECKTAADIWLVFQQRYGSQTREDELRLEQEVLDTVKLASDTIDEHIQKFHDLIAAMRAQQEPTQRYDDTKVNMTFLRSLERAQIPHEDWMGFVAFLGKTWLTITPDTLYSEARTYYRTHLAHRKPAIPATSPDERVLAGSTFAPPFSLSGQRGRGQTRGRQRGRGNNPQRASAPTNLPRDPNAWCTHCQIPGHSFEMCWKKTQTRQQSTGQQSFGQQPAPQYEGNQKPSAPKGTSRGLTVRTLRNGSEHSKAWTYDSACTEHLTGNASHFTTYDDFLNPIPIYGIGNSVHYAYGKGIVTVQDANGNNYEIHDVWWVPNLRDSIISKARTKCAGLNTGMDEHENIYLYALDGSNFAITSTEIDNMTMFMDLRAVPLNSETTVSETVSETTVSRTMISEAPTALKLGTSAHAGSQIMHERLGHASADRLRLIGISYNSSNCHEYRLGKLTRLPFHSLTLTATVKLERIYSDICYVTPISFGMAKYFITFIDELTRYCWVYMIPDKSSTTILRILQV